MRIYNEMYPSLSLREEAVVTGMVTGDLLVGDGGSVIITGMVQGALLVDSGGVAEITGRVGSARAADGGRILIAAGASVGSQIANEDGRWVPALGTWRITDETPRFVLGNYGELSSLDA